MLLSRRILAFNKCLTKCFIRLNSSEQIDYLKSILANGVRDWPLVQENVLKKYGNYNNKNIDSMMLKLMVRNKEFDAAMEFADFLKTNNRDNSLGATNGLLNLYFHYGMEHELSNVQKQFILDSYVNLYEKYKILDYSTAENLLHALCVINEWKKCIKVLEDIKISGTPSHSAYSTLIGTLFKINKKSEAMKMITKSMNDRRPLLDYAYEEWLKYINRKYKDNKTIIKYLNEISTHISNSCIPITKLTANRIKEAYSQVEWDANLTSMHRKTGECTTCHQKLDCLKLTDEEFLQLQNNVKDKLIVGSDLFLKSSPGELQRFSKFVEKTAPYDIVLDALNISFLANKNMKDRLYVLGHVVHHFAKQDMKVLLLGRKHMLKWNRSGLEYLMAKSLTFFTDDISQDDPYFITAAILSGSHTDIVSRDLLRGHRFVLQDENLRRIFQRWQWQHQWKVFMGRKGPNIQSPLPFTPCAQYNNGVWHIPYESENASNDGRINDGIPDCSTWLCLRQKNSQ
ncbi:mitochondrial ribonuclease P catalytic subunit [Colias croceus]|uniref:mitochondrial ribonuclease P catalytic subunit n=1 Tax=Colias crocea TaxID=72248 RepID=UPI001E27EAD8|nr:mitochondrial ribonuclease P catalytic subunit [Colias croceus]